MHSEIPTRPVLQFIELMVSTAHQMLRKLERSVVLRLSDWETRVYSGFWGLSVCVLVCFLRQTVPVKAGRLNVIEFLTSWYRVYTDWPFNFFLSYSLNSWISVFYSLYNTQNPVTEEHDIPRLHWFLMAFNYKASKAKHY